MGARLVVNQSHVVHETIDGEAILIHLGTGTYYSLDGAGAEVWGLLAAGADEDALLAAAQQRYEADATEIERALSTLVAELVREELLIEIESAPSADSAGLPEGRIPFIPPVLHVYTDMQEFMLVDPLHEVDQAAGWPHVKSG